MSQLLLIALRNLASHRRRTLMLGGAIAGVTAMLIVLLGLSNGLRSTMLESATTLMSGHVNVGGYFKLTPGSSMPVVAEYPRILEHVKREVPELDYVVQRGRGLAKLISETNSVTLGVGGIDVSQEAGFRKVVKVLEGNLEALSEPNTLLLFEEHAKRLGVKVGDTITLSASTLRGTANTQDVRVVAVAANVGLLSSFACYVSDGTLRSLYRLRQDSTGALQLYLKDMNAIPAVQARLRESLKTLGYEVMEPNPQPFAAKFQLVNREAWTGQKLDVSTWEDEISTIQWTSAALSGLTGMLTFVLLVIISVGIMNTLWIAIRERTREIGTLRAIGMQRGGVMRALLVEAMCLGLLGTLTGALVGMGVCFAMNAANLSVPQVVQIFTMSEKLRLVVSAGSVVKAVAFITLCTTATALFPSFLAARLKPITAMHHIG
jgi:ABC-type lipoprotein release transport system permease subunit